MEISVVIPAYNAERCLNITLKSLFSMKLSKEYEVIVVDDGSTDKTKSIVKKYKKAKLICQNRKGPGAARNIGIKKAKGQFIYFIDSDCEVEKDTVQKLYDYITNKRKIGAVGGSIELPRTEKNILAIADHYCSWYHHNPGQKSGQV
ncbi:MAG: glycosyltransferase family 2 protein, partial [Nanoarchaeota archaeon]|nr:glycosyltransferase family 2 protein [Nanoarchaeota archaeon]